MKRIQVFIQVGFVIEVLMFFSSGVAFGAEEYLNSIIILAVGFCMAYGVGKLIEVNALSNLAGNALNKLKERFGA